MVAKHVNKKNADNPLVLAINALLHSLDALAVTFSAMAFYRVFSLTWPAYMQIYWNKRKRLHKKRV